MSKYQSLIDSLAYAKQTGGIGLTASVADLDALLADLERAEKALKEADFDFSTLGYSPDGPFRVPIRAALAQMVGG